MSSTIIQGSPWFMDRIAELEAAIAACQQANAAALRQLDAAIAAQETCKLNPADSQVKGEE